LPVNPRCLFVAFVLVASCNRIPPEPTSSGSAGLAPAPPSTPSSTPPSSATGASADPTPPAHPSAGADRPHPTRPTVDVPTGTPPTTLQQTDITVGTGATAHAGARIEVHYAGVAWSTRREFDASWNTGRPFPFTLGRGQVIPGWDRGVEGMRVGGRRRLVIPPDLGYGARGSPPAIGPNETLVFVVDLLSVGG